MNVYYLSEAPIYNIVLRLIKSDRRTFSLSNIIVNASAQIISLHNCIITITLDLILKSSYLHKIIKRKLSESLQHPKMHRTPSLFVQISEKAAVMPMQV